MLWCCCFSKKKRLLPLVQHLDVSSVHPVLVYFIPVVWSAPFTASTI